MSNAPAGQGDSRDGKDQPDQKLQRLVARDARVLWVAVLGAIGFAVVTGVASWARDSIQAARTEPLAADVHWPTIRSCDGATMVAMPAGGVPIEELAATSNEVDERILAIEVGAGAYVDGYLTLLLSSQDDSPSVIRDIRAVVFNSQPTELDWILDVEGGCGEVYERQFLLDLTSEHPSVVDAGIGGIDSSGLRDSDPMVDSEAVRGDPLGPAFSIDKNDAARLQVRVTSRCGHEVEWGLIIDYTHQGSRESLHLGSEEAPFRSVEGPGPRYVFDEGTEGLRAPSLREAAYSSWACG